MDLIIICTIYGVTKISKLSLKFNEIIEVYEKKWNFKKQTNIHLVELEDETKTGDLIIFYNKVFIKFLRDYLKPGTSNMNTNSSNS
jgi:retinoblastoma-like protein 1